jgi:putative ABC transport system permease protein
MSAIAGARFEVLYALRSSFGRQRAATLLTTLAIATSVAIAAALELSSQTVETQLEATATALAGASELEVTGGALGVPDSFVESVAEVPGVRVAAPFMQTTFSVEGAPELGALYVLGVDLLQDHVVRGYGAADDRPTIEDPLALAADIRSVLVTRSFAERLGLGPGDSFPVARGSLHERLVIRGLLERGGVAEAFGGSIAVMDVYALQTILGRKGWLDRIDVVAADGADLGALQEGIAAHVAGFASVRRSAARDEWVDRTMATVRTLSLSLAAIGAFVAVLLVFGATSVAVDRRARELALLRSIGLEAARVRQLLHVDAFVVSMLAIAVGLPAGIALARVFLPLLSQISAYLQDVRIESAGVGVPTILVALAVGLGVAQAGTYLPARRAAEASPLAVMRGETFAAAPRWPTPLGWVALLAVALGWLALSSRSFGLPPLVRVVLIFGAGTGLVTFAVARLLPAGVRSGRGVLEVLVPRVGRLVGESLTGRPRDSRVTIAAVAGVLSGLTAILVMVECIAFTFDHWIAEEYRDAILVTAGTPFAGRDRELVLPKTVQTIRALPEVRAVAELFTANIPFGGEEVLLVAQTAGVIGRYGELPAVDGDPAELAERLARGEIAVSDAFADHFRIGPGDTLELSTPRGPRSFRVAGLFRDYVGPAGSLQIDMAVFDALWRRDGSYLIAVWANPPDAVAIEKIREAVGDGQELFFVYGEALKRYAGDVLRQLTGLLTQVALLTAVLGGIAITNLLVAAVTDRRRELMLLRSVGATNGLLTALILVDGALLALPSALAGIAVGVACAHPMVTDVLREAFGWSVSFRIAPMQLAMLFAGVALATLVASLYPAWLCRRMLPRDVFAPE